MSPAASPHDRPRLAQRTRWCTAEAPAPRLAYNGAELAYPGLSRRAWFRLCALLWWRGLIADPCARRMARHLARCADERGRVTDLPEVISSYLARHHLRSPQTFWTDLARLTDRGLVRQLQGAAPGYPARYQLAFPATALPDRLPADLAAELRRAARLPLAEIPATTPAGPVEQEAPAGLSAGFCGGLDPSPMSGGGSSPPPRLGSPGRPTQRCRDRPGGVSSKERDHAMSVLSDCRGEWRLQRGPAPPLTAAELDRLVLPTALALREVPPGEVRQLLTWQVRSARDLAALLAWRLGRARAAAGAPARLVAADEHGAGCAALVAARAAAYASRGPAAHTAIAAARTALIQAQDRYRAQHTSTPSSLRLVTAGRPPGEDATTGPTARHKQRAPT